MNNTEHINMERIVTQERLRLLLNTDKQITDELHRIGYPDDYEHIVKLDNAFDNAIKVEAKALFEQELLH